jgi:predicted choloylglycine hydrolase
MKGELEEHNQGNFNENHFIEMSEKKERFLRSCMVDISKLQVNTDCCHSFTLYFNNTAFPLPEFLA